MRLTAAIGLSFILGGCGNVVVEATTGGGAGGSTSTPTTSTSAAGGAGTVGSGGGDFPVGGAGGGGGCPPGAPDVDADGDGYSPLQGDCNECDPLIGPGSAEGPTPDPDGPGGGDPPVDEDCDGLFDEPPDVCDEGLALDATDPIDAVRAIDLCGFVSECAPFGVLSASWQRPDGQPPPAGQIEAFRRGHGILTDLGANAPAQVGARLLALSNGTARPPSHPEYEVYYDKGYSSQYPPGMPIEGPCPDVTTGPPFDGITLEVQLSPPANALGLAYRYRFYTRGWPKDVCSPYNDQFVALMSPAPAGAWNGNIAFDDFGNPLTLSYLTPEACWCGPGQCPDSPPCATEAAQLAGSGFDAAYGAATKWLKTTAPVDHDAESFTLRFTIFDAEDGLVDSTVLIDGFEWIVEQQINTTNEGP